MIGRRAVLLGGVGLAARPAAANPPIPPADRIEFRMIRHGNEIGRHVVAFERRNDLLTVRVTVDAQVRFLSIPIVRYRHRAEETWQGGVLVALTGETDKNGEHEWMNARRAEEGLVVTGSQAARYVAPESAIGVTYWNKRQLDGPMIGMDDGMLLRPKIAEHPGENIPLASGGTVVADHFNLSGAFAADVWYDRSNTWAGLAFTVADGSLIHYERL